MTKSVWVCLVDCKTRTIYDSGVRVSSDAYISLERAKEALITRVGAHGTWVNDFTYLVWSADVDVATPIKYEFFNITICE